MHRLIEFSLKHRFLMIALLLLLCAVGIYNLYHLPIDAVPDVTPNIVDVTTFSPGLSPVEVEKMITIPVETAMSGLPGLEQVRSVSRPGLSTIQLFFKDNVDLYFARRLAMERLPEAEDAIPEGFGTPELGPITTGLGEIYQFEVKGAGKSLMDLRTILDWDIAPRLRTVPGVIEVSAWGGELKTYEVQLDADQLVAHKLSLEEIFETLQKNNMNSGGAYIERAGEAYNIRAEGLIGSIGDIENIVISSTPEGTPQYIKDVAKVSFAPHVRFGAVTRDGKEIVAGIVMMLKGENSRTVVDRVKEQVKEIQKSLPAGVVIDAYYDRTVLVRKTIETVRKNLVEGGVLVVIILFLMLGSLRSGLIVASAIPLSMLFAFTGMRYFGISGNLMSLGAIDFGLIVDASVVLVENIVRKMKETKIEFAQVIKEAGREVARPIFFGVSIIMIVYFPILTLQGIEGKMFRPMAMTVLFALIGSLLIAFLVIPAFAYFFLRKRRISEETWLVRKAQQFYQPLLAWHQSRPVLTVAGAIFVFVIGIVIVPFLGAEFIPKLDEGAIAMLNNRLPGVSLTETIKNTAASERVLKSTFPEIITVVSRSGQSEVPTDPMGVDLSDVYVILKPKEQWKSADDQEELADKMREVLEENVPNSVFSFTQPIEERFDEIIGGAKSDIAVQLFGTNLAELKTTADQIAAVLSRIDGAEDVKAEAVSGMPYLRIRVRRDQLGRYGVNASSILQVVETLAGKQAGEVMEEERRFGLQVRFAVEDRDNISKIGELKVVDSHQRLIPLKELADLRVEEGPAQISRENFHRRISIETNVSGRDIAGFVSEARKKVQENVELPSGYWMEWGGEFRHLESAAFRLAIIVPITLALIFVLLYTALGSVKLAALIFTNVPIATTGGIVALLLRGMPFSISAAVGFIALYGIVVLNGVVLVTYIRQKRSEGLAPEKAATEAAQIRLRPVLTTALVASFGFVPMAIATGSGAEVQKPLATVVIGGLMTSTILTLIVLPTIYKWFDRGVPMPETTV
jgi:heavy metal efflux system protein